MFKMQISTQTDNHKYREMLQLRESAFFVKLVIKFLKP